MTLLEEWITKAEGDYDTAVALKRLKAKPQYDAICYHCQQSAEKYFKAAIFSNGRTPPRIHDLEDLLNLCVLHAPFLRALEPEAKLLDPYSVEFRYPGDFATSEEAVEAIKSVRKIRSVMRKLLGVK